jgi:hypothetical protein
VASGWDDKAARKVLMATSRICQAKRKKVRYGCGETFPCTGAKLCPECLAAIMPGVDCVDMEPWEIYLNCAGLDMARAQFTGQRVYENELWPAENSDGDTKVRKVEELPGAGVEMTMPRLLAASDEDVLDWFVNEKIYLVSRITKLPIAKIQRLRSEYLDYAPPDLELARQTLGYSNDSWRRRKLGLAIERARAEMALEELRAEDVAA